MLGMKKKVAKSKPTDALAATKFEGSPITSGDIQWSDAGNGYIGTTPIHTTNVSSPTYAEPALSPIDHLHELTDGGKYGTYSYVVVFGDHAQQLTERVSLAMEKGYLPQGGMVIGQYGTLMQPMCRPESL